MMSLIEKNISMPYPKKYSKSPSVVHSIRAICEKTPKSKSCKKFNLVGKKDDGTFIEKKIWMPYPKKYSKSPSVVHSIRASSEKTTESKSC